MAFLLAECHGNVHPLVRNRELTCLFCALWSLYLFVFFSFDGGAKDGTQSPLHAQLKLQPKPSPSSYKATMLQSDWLHPNDLILITCQRLYP
jgi:hypothetical protein